MGLGLGLGLEKGHAVIITPRRGKTYDGRDDTTRFRLTQINGDEPGLREAVFTVSEPKGISQVEMGEGTTAVIGSTHILFVGDGKNPNSYTFVFNAPDDVKIDREMRYFGREGSFTQLAGNLVTVVTEKLSVPQQEEFLVALNAVLPEGAHLESLDRSSLEKALRAACPAHLPTSENSVSALLALVSKTCEGIEDASLGEALQGALKLTAAQKSQRPPTRSLRAS